jgi:selenocysteine lyase/cysteine desulfurase
MRLGTTAATVLRQMVGITSVCRFHRPASGVSVSSEPNSQVVSTGIAADPARVRATFAFTLPGITPRQIATELGKRGIATWDGDYYAYELIRALGLAESGGMVRVGLVHYNEPAEIERLAQALREIAESAAAHPPT